MPADVEIHLDEALPPRDAWSEINEHCPIFHALGVVSTRSAFLVMREAFYGATRFEQFVQRAGVSDPVAAARLRELTDAGLLEKVPYRDAGQRTRSEYRLTEKGAELLPALVALFRWGSRWALPDRARTDIVHAGCGAPVNAVLRCEHDHSVDAGQLTFVSRRRDLGRGGA